VGRFCLNCGHPVGEPVDPQDDFLPWLHDDEPTPSEEDATYDESNPPIALPPELAAICTPIAPWADREEYAFGQPVLQAKATLYHVPRGAD